MRSEEFREKVEQLGYGVLGQRLFRARTYHDLSVRDLADRAQVSKNTITRIEKGLPVHIETLRILARALKLKPENLVAAEFDVGNTVSVARTTTGRWFDLATYTGSMPTSPELSADPDQWASDAQPFSPLASRDIEGRFNPNLIVLRAPTERRSHRGEEFAYVLTGRLRVVFDDRAVELEAGDSIYFWAAESHRYEPISEDVKLLSIVLDPVPTSTRGLRFARN
ncbi:MAG: helix-turn-helix transcriptional regulator [Chthonomonas sp.]|nr:helix-turn-helix transcriptional regulator [Chthonomonas sp.]